VITGYKRAGAIPALCQSATQHRRVVTSVQEHHREERSSANSEQRKEEAGQRTGEAGQERRAGELNKRGWKMSRRGFVLITIPAYVAIKLLFFISFYNGDKFKCSLVALTPGVTNFSKEPTKPAIDVNPEQGVIAGVAYTSARL
jgi:hypothetical protein